MNKKKTFLNLYIVYSAATLCYVIRTIAIRGNAGGLAIALMLLAIISVSLHRNYKNKD